MREGEEGRQEWKAAFNSYAGDFAYSHVGTETVKNRMGAVGMWGDYCECEGHGQFVKWERKASGTLKKVVVPIRDAATGQIKVPDAECIAEYIMVMAIGDTKADFFFGRCHDAWRRTDFHVGVSEFV